MVLGDSVHPGGGGVSENRARSDEAPLCLRRRLTSALRHRIRAYEAIPFVVFGFLLSLSFVAGWHIHVEEPIGWGDSSQDYVEPLEAVDFLVLALLTVVFSTVSLVIYRLLKSRAICEPDMSRVDRRKVAIVAIVLFVAWLPYLLAYWPGLVFGDSLNSIRQLEGSIAWNNQHPIPYTLFIGACLFVSKMAFGELTFGVALYSVIQMAFMAACIGFLICWAQARAQLHAVWLVVLTAVFALSPYIGASSIAMWKDPAFSSALVILSIILADLAFSRGSVCGRSWLMVLAAFSVITVFTRNNGVFIVGLCCLACVLASIADKDGDSSAYRSASLVLGCVTLVGLIVIGPLYSALGVQAPKVEGAGVMLSQMANVVVKDGDMDEEDYRYVDELMPVDKYVEVYTPRHVDQLKKSEFLNAKALDDGFYGHWAKLLVKNPNLYIEAWMLETYGYWTVNRPELYSFSENIVYGVPRNVSEERFDQLTKRSIYAKNLLGSDYWRDVFTIYGPFFPVGIFTWLSLYLAACFIASGRARWIVSLIPAISLALSLLLAAPLFYWPRYGLGLQMLIPFFVALLGLLGDSAMPVDSAVRTGKDLPR